MRKTGLSVGVLTLIACLTGCHQTVSGNPSVEPPATNDQNVVNLYIWADYMAPDTLSNFQKRTGIKVNVSYFDTPEILESRILTGNSGFDVVLPTLASLHRQIQSGAYLVLDKKKLPNLINVDATLTARIASADPGNEHAVIYTWGTFGLGYNVDKVASALGGPLPDGWGAIFDPIYAKQLASCGISITDDPAGIVRLVMLYLGKSAASPSLDDLNAVQGVLTNIRPFVRNINAAFNMDAMAQGEACIAIGYSGAFIQARQKTIEDTGKANVRYMIPKEGSLLWFDMLAIPRDAPHPGNAYRLINFLMDPQVMADITNTTKNANANTAAAPFLIPSVASDSVIHPSSEQLSRLYPQSEDPPEVARAINRLWQKFKAGQ